LVVECVSKSFGGLQAVDEVSLRLNFGERRALIGPNGAGKTTLFHLICGVHPVTSGKICLFGRDVTRDPVYKRAVLGVARTFQINNLFPTLTVLENVLLALQAHERSRFAFHRMMSSFRGLQAQGREVLGSWDYWERRNAVLRSLSYGEQREMEIVVALAQRPKLLLLDEPTSGLSAAETARVTKMIQSLDRNIIVLLIEHDMDVCFELAEKISVLYNGRLVADGSTEEVRRDPTVQAIYLGSRSHERPRS
jgi:branched-chain amino acid transport system ATP-binding protein